MAAATSPAANANAAAASDPEQKKPGQKEPEQEPRGLGEHTCGLSGEYAHEQGWGLDGEERTRQPQEPQNIDGGADYEYGAHDEGDEPVNTALDPNSGGPMQNKPAAETGKDQS